MVESRELAGSDVINDTLDPRVRVNIDFGESDPLRRPNVLHEFVRGVLVAGEPPERPGCKGASPGPIGHRACQAPSVRGD
jgi:hypothetical protein